MEEQEPNYREEVQKARLAAQAIKELHGYPDEIDAYWEMVCGTVVLAEYDLREQDYQWEIASLAREMLQYARPLEEYDHMLNKLYSATKRMIDALADHPRLKAELLEFEILIMDRVEAQNDGRGNLSSYLREDLAALQANIRLADEGRLSEIPQKGHLMSDPIEWTARWEEIIDEADKKVYQQLSDSPRGMGFCHAFWYTRTEVLRNDYNLEWRSPSIMNPRVMFD
jgi:hypothetical protein